MAVYIIRAGDTEFVKIGWAISPKARCQELQNTHWLELRIIRLIQGTPFTERWMHRHFKSRNIRGEWFLFEEDMLTVQPPSIDSVVKPPSVKIDPVAKIPRVKSELVPRTLRQTRANGGAENRVCHLVRRAGGAAALARRLGCARTTVLNWCATGAIPAARVVEFIDEFGISVDDVMALTIDRFPPQREAA